MNALICIFPPVILSRFLLDFFFFFAYLHVFKTSHFPAALLAVRSPTLLVHITFQKLGMLKSPLLSKTTQFGLLSVLYFSLDIVDVAFEISVSSKKRDWLLDYF